MSSDEIEEETIRIMILAEHTLGKLPHYKLNISYAQELLARISAFMSKHNDVLHNKSPSSNEYIRTVRRILCTISYLMDNSIIESNVHK